MSNEEDGPFFKTRRSRVEPGEAGTTGAEHAFATGAGGTFTVAMCNEMIEHLIGRGFRQDVLITVHPTARNPQNLATAVVKLMESYREWWSGRHAVGPNREPVWFDFFVVACACGDNHASHAHVVLTVELSATDTGELEARAAKGKLPLQVTGNTAEWLANKPRLSEHKCKIEYAIFHLLQARSVYEIGKTETFPFVKRIRSAFRAWKASRPTPEAGDSLRLPKPLFKVPKKPKPGQKQRARETVSAT